MTRKRGTRKIVTLSTFAVALMLACVSTAPAWGTVYYVSTDGNDTNAGTSPKLAWRTITHAARVAKAGDLVRIKGGDYGHERVVMKNSGTAEAPIRFEAYDGDARLDGLTKEAKEKLEQKWEKEGASLKKKGVSLNLQGHGVEIIGAHVRVSSITMRRYGVGIVIKGHHNTVERCTAGLCSWAAISVGGHHNEVRHCTAYNSAMTNIWVSGHDNAAADCWSFSNPRLIGILPGVDTGTDYTYGSSNARKIRYIRCRGDGRLHAGHGICFTVGGGGPESTGCEDCSVTDCEMYGCWELFGVRHKGHNITFTNCYGQGKLVDTLETKDMPAWRKQSSNWYNHGFYYRTGAHDITVKNCRVNGVRIGLNADDAGGRWKAWGVTRNVTFENCIATDCIHGIRLNAPNSKAVNCLSARNCYGVTGFEKGTIVKNCIICKNRTAIRGNIPTATTITHCNIWDNQTKLSGKGSIGADCISEDPQFAGRTDYGDWQLKETSPCKDMGPYAGDPKATIGMR